MEYKVVTLKDSLVDCHHLLSYFYLEKVSEDYVKWNLKEKRMLG